MANNVLYMARDGDCLIPTDKISLERLHDGVKKEGKPALVRFETPRNPSQHRLLFATANLIAQNSDDYADAEHVVTQWKFQTGLVHRRRYYLEALNQWYERAEPRSIAFASMRQEEFAAWFNKVVDYILRVMWPGISEEMVRRELSDMLGLDVAPMRRAA